MSESSRHARRSILRSTLVMSILTILSRILGLVREQVRGYYIGTGMESDAFGIASTIPNMLRRLFAEGAMTAAFVPVFTGLKTDADRERLSRFYSGFMTLFLILMAFVTLMGVLAAAPLVTHVFAGRFEDVPGKVDLTISLTQVMFPYLFFVAIAAIVQATLNSFGVFGPSAFAPVLLNGANIAVVVLFSDRFPNAAWALAAGFLLGGFLQLGFQIPFLRGKGIRFRPTMAGLKDPAVWQVAVIFLPGIFSAGIYQINVTISQVIATSLAPGSVASLQYSVRLQELVLGVFAVSVATVILPTMSEQAHRGDIFALKKTLNYSIGLLGFVTIPASVGLVILGEPIVRMLFQYGRFDAHSTAMTSWALYFHGSGIFFIALYRTVVQVFYAQKDLKTPTILAAFVMVLHIGLCYWLAVPLENGGVAAAGSLAAAVNSGLLLWVLRQRIGKLAGRDAMKSLGKTCVATVA
ncbi:MAG: murein biosynthesis integral membrane protein MurJ, partial [Deltaproteobacteria bacterium]|nr:murein biosynthesis integral membrane protein MurJ [Deltaproteobacteria bacterium]